MKRGEPIRGRTRQWAVAAILVAACALFTASIRAGIMGGNPDAGPLSRSAADALAAKIATLSMPPSVEKGPLEPVTITEQESNAYLKLRGQEFLPRGLHDPEVHILPNQLTGAANVNFDELGATENKSDDLTSRMMAYVFKGTQRVTAAGTLETGNGQGKFTLTRLTVGNVSLPPSFVTFLVHDYVEKHYKIDIDKPFPLPANVSHIELGPGRATFRRIALARR